ncbi:SIS domain-containing protein [Novosphingobium sp.]|uniref:SIS domain-containing protein n=1 Tax=Novosphingobium sp. TaxID=1874826 RepID=UPI003D0A37F2
MTGQITWSELTSQPDAWERLLARLDAGHDLPAVSLDAFDEVVMVGSGTSYYLALAAADWVSRRHGIAARAVPSCEVMLDTHQVAIAPGRKRLVVAFSRSGESSELVLAVEAFQAVGAFVLGISCSAGSSLLQIADLPFLIGEGFEDGLVMLRSFTGMLLALQYLFGSADDRAALRTLPAAGREVLARQAGPLRDLARRRAFDRFVCLASGANYPLALEAGLKAQEMAIFTSEAYHSLEYRHGPKATADQNTLLTLFALPDARLGLSLARDMKALGVTLLVVGPDAARYADVADMVVPAPAALDDGQASVISLLPLQILAYETAMRCGKNPDAPEKLNKVVILEPATV